MAAEASQAVELPGGSIRSYKADACLEDVDRLLFWQEIINKHLKKLSKLVELLQNEYPAILPKIEQSLCEILSSLPQPIQMKLRDQSLVLSGTIPNHMSEDEANLIQVELALYETNDPTTWYRFAWERHDKKDHQRAVKWYTKAAKCGHLLSQNNLAVCYERGDGVEKDEKKAFGLYMKAAEAGNSTSQKNVGLCYKMGIGVQQDWTKAVEWLTRASQAGSPSALSQLALCYQEGTGVKQDLKKAFELLTDSAERGDVIGKNNLGSCYLKGAGVKQDWKKAFALFTAAAEAGCGEAAYNLGDCYQHGMGVEKNKQKAMEWYTKAAEHGIKAAQSM